MDHQEEEHDAEFDTEQDSDQAPPPLGHIVGNTTPFRLTLELNVPLRRSAYVETHHEERPFVFNVERVWKDKKGSYAEIRVIGESPQTPFPFSAEFFLASEENIKKTLGIDNAPIDSVSIGKLYKTDIPVYLLIDKFGRCFITGKSGSGKSYTVGVLIEEFLRRRVPCIIIDRHGEYVSLKVKNEENPPKEYDIFFEDSEHSEIISQVEKKLTELESDIKQKILERKAKKAAAQDGDIDIEELGVKDVDLNDLEIESGGLNYLEEEPEEDSLPKKLIDGWDEEYGFSKHIIEFGSLEFNPGCDLSLEMLLLADAKDLVNVGQCTIANLIGSDIETQETIVAKLLKKLYTSALRRELPPFFLFIDEAHLFAGKKSSECVDMVKLFAQEGRKFGANIVIITQKPQLLDTTIRAQAGTWIIHKLTDTTDINMAIKSSEGLSNSHQDDIASLLPGEAIVTGEASSLVPLFLEVRQRFTVHGGAGYNILDAVQDAEEYTNTQLKESLINKLGTQEVALADVLSGNVGVVGGGLTPIAEGESTAELKAEIAQLKAALTKAEEKKRQIHKKIKERNQEIARLKNEPGFAENYEALDSEIGEWKEKFEKEKDRADEAVALAEKLLKKIRGGK